MFNKVRSLTVKYNNIVVGYLAELSDGKIAFEYERQWLDGGFSISPLSLPLKQGVYISSGVHFNGLYGVFRDSLPDGYGELVLRRKLAASGINYDKIYPLTRLSLVSENGMGALTYYPSQADERDDEHINLDRIARDAQKVLGEEVDVDALERIYRLGGSSGGARPKVNLKIENDYWIVKFPCSFDPTNIAEIEFLTNELAVKCGLNVNKFRMFKAKEYPGFFGAKRFDRLDGKRVHMLSLSSMLETTHRIANLDYTHLFQVADRICDEQELYEVFRRMCFNVYAGNKDDHGKNFAFLYDENTKKYTLSPAYDLTTIVGKAEHEMTVNGCGNPTDADMLTLAYKFRLSHEKCVGIMNNIKKIICNHEI